MIWLNTAFVVVCAYWSVTDYVRGYYKTAIVGLAIGAMNAAVVLTH